MNATILQKSIEKLTANYGELPEEYVELLKRRFINVEDIAFEKAIDEVIDTIEYRPKMNQIHKAINKAQQGGRPGEQISQWDEQHQVWTYTCPVCRDTGCVDGGMRKQHGTSYTSSKPCPAHCGKGNAMTRTAKHIQIFNSKVG